MGEGASESLPRCCWYCKGWWLAKHQELTVGKYGKMQAHSTSEGQREELDLCREPVQLRSAEKGAQELVSTAVTSEMMWS